MAQSVPVQKHDKAPSPIFPLLGRLARCQNLDISSVPVSCTLEAALGGAPHHVETNLLNQKPCQHECRLLLLQAHHILLLLEHQEICVIDCFVYVRGRDWWRRGSPISVSWGCAAHDLLCDSN